MSGRAAADSGAEDLLIVVDEADNVLEYASKQRCHDGDGILHRAFSIFIFNREGALLVQERSAVKRLWPLHWSNSCCSHPRKGESVEEASVRRLKEELGLETTLRELYAFIYHARYGDEGSEHELCVVLVGKSDATPRVDPAEIAAWRWVPPDALDRELEATPERFTPWFKLEWQRLRKDFLSTLEGL